MSEQAGADQSPVRHAGGSPAAWVLMLGVLCLGLGADLATKSWSFASVASRSVELDRVQLVESPHYDPVPPHAGVIAIPHVLRYRLVINRGAVFGFASNQRAFFVVFTGLAVIAGLWVFCRMLTDRAWLGHVAVGLALAGGLGNLYDRLQFGVVRDFIHLLPGKRLPMDWTWPGGSPELFPWVFNIADALLLTGMIMLMVNLHRRGGRPAPVRGA